MSNASRRADAQREIQHSGVARSTGEQRGVRVGGGAKAAPARQARVAVALDVAGRVTAGRGQPPGLVAQILEAAAYCGELVSTFERLRTSWLPDIPGSGELDAVGTHAAGEPQSIGDRLLDLGGGRLAAIGE